MITLTIRISGSGPATFAFSSGTISAVHFTPPTDGSGVGVVIGNLQPGLLSVSTTTGTESTLLVDVIEGQDPIWLGFTIDCTGGGSVSVGFAGSPTVRVNSGSFLGLEYDNGKPAPFVTPQQFP